MMNIYAGNTPAPVGLTANDRQVEWYHREQMGFIHKGEWGNGTADPVCFNPLQPDASQWVKTFKDAGFTTIILVAGYHGGFWYRPGGYNRCAYNSAVLRKAHGELSLVTGNV